MVDSCIAAGEAEMYTTRVRVEVFARDAVNQYFPNTAKGGEIRHTKTLNLSRNTVAFQVFDRCFSFFSLRDQLVAQQKHLLRVEERCCQVEPGSTVSNKFRLYIFNLLLVFHQTLNLSRNKFVVMPPSSIHTKQINQSACCIFSTRNKCFCCATS